MVKIKDSKEYFYACNGAVLKNLDELLDFLKSADDGSLSYHFNADKNDFANWTRDILKLPEIAKKMFGSKNRGEIIFAIIGEAKKPAKKRSKKATVSEIKKSVRKAH